MAEGYVDYASCPSAERYGGPVPGAQDWSVVADRIDDAAVFGQVSQHTRTYAYDRPGTPVGESFSRSDPALVPGSKHVTDTDSGHHVHQEQPRLVTHAIVRVLDEVNAAQ